MLVPRAKDGRGYAGECGKEGGMLTIMNHIEANHIAGISIPCGLCGQVVKTRNALANHKFRLCKNQ